MFSWHLTALWTVLSTLFSVLLSSNFATSVPGYLDFDNLPETNFTCDGKVIGGYYADIETGCQMFHVCTIGQKGDMTDIKFLCLNGTVFDQETRVCERVDEVDCSKSKDFYDLNLELYNNGFSLPSEEPTSSEEESVEETDEELDEEFYDDENYDTETERVVETSTFRTTSTSTTTTTTTTTQKPSTTTSHQLLLPNLQNKNIGTHLTGVVPSKPLLPPLQNKNTGTHLTGIVPNKKPQPSVSFKPYVPSTKPPYLNYNPYSSFQTTSQSPVATLFALQNAYNAHKSVNYQNTDDTRPIVVLNHHFPTNFQPKRKNNPTILALQSQQKKVHKLHQEGIEIAEHRIAEINNRNAEISHLQSQQEVEPEEDGKRETKEIHYGSPSIAIVTSTSSTSSSLRTVQPIKQRSSGIGKILSIVRTSTEPSYKLELERLFDKEENVDIEQLLLAWKLKTNKELTVGDFEKLFSTLDSSKFKNGEAISLSDIFNLMNSTLSESTTKLPPKNYEDYTEEDVSLDPFYKDVPKLKPIIGKNIKFSHSRLKRDEVAVNTTSNGRFQTRRKNKGVDVAEIKVTGRNRSRPRQRSQKIDEQTKSNETKIEIVTAKPFPVTKFDCADKVIGGLYADVEAGCEFFHICSVSQNNTMTDNKFYCGSGTLFNQRSRTCQSKNLVNCSSSSRYFHLNDQPHLEEQPEELKFEPKKISHG